MLTAGQPAPLFELPDADMALFDLREQLGQHLFVLYFYPKDDTPGCTLQAIEFSEREDAFAACGCEVLGVSRDECFTHADFIDKHGISIRLLSDTDAEVCRLYGVWQEREVDGRLRMGLVRSTFIIDHKGVIRHAMYGVQPRGHADEVLALVRQLALKGKQHDRRQEHRRHP